MVIAPTAATATAGKGDKLLTIFPWLPMHEENCCNLPPSCCRTCSSRRCSGIASSPGGLLKAIALQWLIAIAHQRSRERSLLFLFAVKGGSGSFNIREPMGLLFLKRISRRLPLISYNLRLCCWWPIWPIKNDARNLKYYRNPGYSSESTQRELFNEYQFDRV